MPTDPTFIVVCSNTSVSKLVYDWISGSTQGRPGGTEIYRDGALPLFRNVEGGRRVEQPRLCLSIAPLWNRVRALRMSSATSPRMKLTSSRCSINDERASRRTRSPTPTFCARPSTLWGSRIGSARRSDA